MNFADCSSVVVEDGMNTNLRVCACIAVSTICRSHGDKLLLEVSRYRNRNRSHAKSARLPELECFPLFQEFVLEDGILKSWYRSSCHLASTSMKPLDVVSQMKKNDPSIDLTGAAGCGCGCPTEHCWGLLKFWCQQLGFCPDIGRSTQKFRDFVRMDRSKLFFCPRFVWNGRLGNWERLYRIP